MLMRKIYCSRSFALTQNIEVRHSTYLMIKYPEKSFFNQQTASHNDIEAQSSELSEVGGSKPVLNSTYF